MKTVVAEPLFIDQELLEELAAPLRAEGHECVVFDEKPTSLADWTERVADCDQLILANAPLPKEALDAAPNLKYINVAFTGTDHVPVDVAKARDIAVSNAAGYSDDAVAELVLGMTLSLLRELREADAATRKGGRAVDFMGLEIHGRTVGIIGTGRIGMRVAALFKAFGAKLVGYNRSEHEEAKALGLAYLPLNELLKVSDIVTVHLPATPQTKGLLAAPQFALMKKSAILINAARGPIVNAQDLAAALASETIAGAGVDVFDQEPPLEKSPLFGAPHVLLTPHIGYFTEEAMEKRARLVFANAARFVRGEALESLV
ncbi:MAG: NAD(P)-dependent oxidoreductase [Peptoniphilaceae bacterium]|nr:NAD(P)-dependent oxidoreductase [Peptoniphilaceae bacterium]MDY6086243.1 NAD(P)-dependent oxidoreductase [Peptoniphilaceae bacterium]